MSIDTYYGRRYQALLRQMRKERPCARTWTRWFPDSMDNQDLKVRHRCVGRVLFWGGVALFTSAWLALFAAINAVAGLDEWLTLGDGLVAPLLAWVAWAVGRFFLWIPDAELATQQLRAYARHCGAWDLTSRESQAIQNWLKELPELEPVMAKWVERSGQPQGRHAMLIEYYGPRLATARKHDRQARVAVEGLEQKYGWQARAEVEKRAKKLDQQLPPSETAEVRPRF